MQAVFCDAKERMRVQQKATRGDVSDAPRKPVSDGRSSCAERREASAKRRAMTAAAARSVLRASAFDMTPACHAAHTSFAMLLPFDMR